MTIPQSCLQIQYNPHQNLNDFFLRNGKADLKILMELQDTLNKQNNLEKNNKVGELKYPDF